MKARWWRREETGHIKPCEEGDPGAFRADIMELPGAAVALPDVTMVLIPFLYFYATF